MRRPRPESLAEWLIPLAVVGLAVHVYTGYGFRDSVSRDGGIILYAGQQMAAGVPPYASIFDNAPPLPFLLAGLGAALSRPLALDDILAMRLIYFAVACLSVLAVYLLAKRLFHSHRTAFFAALIFLGFIAFTTEAASGPNAKTPMVLFAVLSLLLATDTRWLWAGASGSLAFLAWQPASIFPLVCLALAALQPPGERRPAIVRSVVGIGLPLAAVSVYFLSQAAFYEMLDGAILFNLRDIDRAGGGLPVSLYFPFRAVHDGYGTALVPIFVGLVMVLYFYAWRRSRHEGWRETLTGDEFSPLLLPFPPLFVWSFFDYQGPPDFFVFLPYAALGFAWLLETVVRRIEEGSGERAARLVTAGLCVALYASAMTTIYATPRSGLDEQLAGAHQIEARYGSDMTLVSVGTPELMALLHRTNPSRYLFVTTGVDQHIDAAVEGGLEGWLTELEGYQPDVIALGRTTGVHTRILLRWLDEHYTQETIGPWTVYAPSTAR